jgi:hypothetical protein
LWRISAVLIASRSALSADEAPFNTRAAWFRVQTRTARFLADPLKGLPA